jgi:L-ascorbate metabolism protein UlaG (beta-lactamase superfamily)
MKILFLIFFCIFLIFLALLITPAFYTSKYSGPISDHFDGKKFFNPGYPSKKSTFAMLRWWWERRNRAPWPEHVENKPHPEVITTIPADEIKVTYVNHSTVLIQTNNFNLLTDPTWDERASPFTWIGPKRVRDPGISFNELPPIDVVVISHNHYDHLNILTLQNLEKKFHPIFLVPLGNKNLLNRNGIANVIEMDWWQQYKFNNDINITFLPARHWSARWLNDRNNTLWGSYGIDINKIKIFFAGDTAYSNNFKTIQKKWGKPDLAFLPIGAYLPEWVMKQSHLNPYEAVKAHLDLETRRSIAIHYGTFQLSDEAFDQPNIDLKKALKLNSLSDEQFMLLPEGQSFVLSSTNE